MFRRTHRSTEEVELNLAAMLDMAFQLLAFFILTFVPPNREGQVDMRMPAARPAADKTEIVVCPGSDPGTPPGVHTLVVSAFSNADGAIASLGIGQTRVENLAELRTKVHAILSDRANPFDQVVLQLGRGLAYGEVLKIVDIFAEQTNANGERITRLSFVDVPG
jgi:biopolymer transport protein ExbD